jgi:hypothetical protein
MAFAFTVDGVESAGNMRMVHGTFTTESGDSSGSLDATTHGLNYIAQNDVKFEAGGIGTPNPKITVSSGTITITVDDTLGYSGTFCLTGK